MKKEIIVQNLDLTEEKFAQGDLIMHQEDGSIGILTTYSLNTSINDPTLHITIIQNMGVSKLNGAVVYWIKKNCRLFRGRIILIQE